MKERKLDFLSRRAVRVTMLITLDVNERTVDGRLPDGYSLDDGIFRFPAGYWESYFVNGKEYNIDGDRTREKQEELITKDLTEKGFSKKEIDEYIAEIGTEEGESMSLASDASNKWLQFHPEFRQEALRLIGEIKKEIQSEVKTELGRNIKRR